MIAGTDARPPAKRRTAFLKARRWFRCCSFGVPVSVSLSFFAVRVAAEQVPGRRLPAAAPWDFRGYSFTARGLLVQCACSLIVAAAPTFGTAPADPCAGAAGSSGTFFSPAAFSSTPPSLSPRSPPSPLSRSVRGTREMWRLRSWLPRPLFILAGEAANERSAQPKQGGACNNSGRPSIFAEGPSAPRASGLDRFLPPPIYLSASLLLSVAWQQPPGSHLGLFPGLGLLRLVLTPSGRVGTPFCCGCFPSASACVLFRTRARSIDSRRWHHCHFPRGITSVSLYPSVAAGPSG